MKDLTLGILAHVDAGKTTLSEALLYNAGAVRRAGRVDHGDAFLDTDHIEKDRGITIYSKEARFQLGDLNIQLLDTPGHADFTPETERVLGVLDCAVLVISASDGVQTHTRTLWKLLQKYEVPVFIFVNKTDQPGFDSSAVMNELASELSPACVSFAERGSAEWEESTAVCDDDMLSRYLDTGEISDTDVRAAVRKRKLFPVCFGSALKMTGISEFMETLSLYAEPPSYPEEFGARVFKISRDERGTRLTHMKITGGVLNVRDEISGGSGDNAWKAKVNSIRLYNGAAYSEVQSAPAGTVCEVTGLSSSRQGDGCGFEPDAPDPATVPVLRYRLVPPDGTDPHKLFLELSGLEDEIPELHPVWNEQLQEIQVRIMGAVQTEVLASVIRERLGEDVSFADGAVMYRETVAAPVEGIGHYEPLRHYAEVHIIISPGEPGSGITVDSSVSTDVLAANWQRLIKTHLEEREFTGVLTGSPLTDVRFTIAAGRANPKHTEGGDFRQATYRAVRQGLMNAENVLLEPYYSYVLELPSEYAGRAMTDLDGMQAVDTSISQSVGTAVLTGMAPVSKIQNYQSTVTYYSKGLGKLSLAFGGYRPCLDADEVIAGCGYDPDADTENPSYSVFCSHGAGFAVPWYEVPEYMHIPAVLGSGEKDPEENTQSDRRGRHEELWISPDEVEAIIKRTFYANSSRDNTRKKFKKNIVSRQNAPEPRINSAPARPERKFMLVDGYNVIFAWKETSELAKVNIDSARAHLLDILSNYQSMTDYEIIAVFDAYRIKQHPEETLEYGNIHVVFTRTAQTADSYIEKFTHDHKTHYDITVVTSDGLEQTIIRGEGAHLISSHEFEDEIRRVNDKIRSILRENSAKIPSRKMDLNEIKDHLEREEDGQ
ncbi:MAG: NYN domain-containing protein [Anaerovoracaceae bacterium]|jgi:ribosomal protection tetracycline resistance protein